MSIPSALVVEAYAMRKIQKEKMKALENNNTATGNLEGGMKITSSGGCFPMMLKKVHPSAAQPQDYANRPAETSRDVWLQVLLLS